MEELFLDDGVLISETEWRRKIDALRERAGDTFFTAIDREKNVLHDMLIDAIRKRLDAHPENRIGVLFSGGLDSSFIAAICKDLGHDIICFTVGYQDGKSQVPLDVEAAVSVASTLQVRLVKRISGFEQTEKIIEKTARLLRPYANPMNVAVGSVVVAAVELAKQHGVSVLFSGLGSEELYAGYERHLKAKDVHEECWQGLKNMYSRDIIRDVTLAEKLDVTIMTPFLDPEIIVESMKFPSSVKLNEAGSKLLLREIARIHLGQHAERKKKAAQYGSAFQRALEKGARKQGLSILEYTQKLNI